jgi:TonB family protein
MNARRNFVACAVLTLALAAAPDFAHAQSDRADPPPRIRRVVLVENPAGPSPSEKFPKISAEKSGTMPMKEGRTLRLHVELGNVRVFTDEHSQISYRAIVEADSRDPGAQEFLRQFNLTASKTSGGAAIEAKVPWQGLRGRFSAAIEVHIPRSFNLEINSGGGTIEVQDIDGNIALQSEGGNISVGRVGKGSVPDNAGSYAARAKRDRLKPVLLAARIETQGGQISVGDVAGTLRATTAGGHILTGKIDGDAFLRTGGGQIFTGRVAGQATLDSGGGNIQIESAGAGVTADAAGGSLVLRQAEAPLHATASSGGLTAWLNAAGAKATPRSGAPKSRQPSQLSSTGGNLVLYVPRNLAATIDARIEQSDGYRIFADPSLPVQISAQDSAQNERTIHYAVRLNGGGEILHLKAVSGNIVLRASDPEIRSGAAAQARWTQGGDAPASLESVNSRGSEDLTDADGFFDEMRRRILESWWGATPVYPDVARQAGIEGEVILRVYVSSDGRVSDIKVLDGPPVLARAAVQAVQQWRYQAPRMGGRPANIVTTLVVAFRLH